jgi:hypothetical protein
MLLNMVYAQEVITITLPSGDEDTTYTVPATVPIVIQATIKGIPKPPKAPSDLSGEPGELENTLHWKDNSNNETNFTVYANNVKLVTLPANTISYLDKPRGNLETVKYWVTALNQRGESPASNIIYVTTLDTTPPTVDIVGNISTSTGLLVGGVNITFSGYSIPAVSDGNGNYSMTVDYNYTGIAIPSANGYTFNPVNRSYTNVTTNQISQNYTAINNPVNISGYVKDNVGNGLIGAIITFSGGGGIATTNLSGYYEKDIVYGYSGTATVSLAGWTFNPPSITYTNLIYGQVVQNYTGTHVPVTISGYVRDGVNNGISNVVMTFSNSTGTVITDATGFYTKDVSYGYSGTVTPSLSKWTFNPSSISYSNVIDNQTNQNYVGIYNYNIVEGPNSWKVNPAGTGLAPHTWNGAWKTFSAINWASIQPGDTIFISGGMDSLTYTGSLTVGKSGVPNKFITVRPGISPGYNGKVIISCSSGNGININQQNPTGVKQYIRVEHMTVKMMQTTAGGYGVYVSSRASQGCNVIYLDDVDIIWNLNGIGSSSTEQFGIKIDGYGGGTSYVDSVFYMNSYLQNTRSTPSINVQCDGIVLQNLSNIFVLNNKVVVNNDTPGRNDTPHNDPIGVNASIYNLTIANNILINSQDVNTCSNGIILGALSGKFDMYNNVLATPFFGWTNGEVPQSLSIYSVTTGTYFYIYNNTFEGGSSPYVVMSRNSNNPYVYFKNNIVAARESGSFRVAFENSTPTWNQINGNLYTTYAKSSSNGLINGYSMTTLRTTYGAETVGIGSDRWNIAESSLFNNYLNYDYSLKDGSPAIDKGVYLGPPYDKDITGKTRSNPPDIGAYEK